MQTECAVCWDAEFPLAGEAEIVGVVAGAVAGSVTVQNQHMITSG